MTTRQLAAVMRFHLGHFNDEGVTIDDGTVHGAVLSADDGFGSANSKAIYKAVIRWTLARSGVADPRWPDDWLGWSVAELAPFLLSVPES